MGTLKYAGNGSSKVFLPVVKGMIVLDRGTTTTVALAKTLAGWVTHIAPATASLIAGTYINLERGMEDKSTAPEFTTANTGFKEKTEDFPPEFTGYAYMSYQDYLTWFAADGKEYNFVLVLNDGSLITPLDSSGLVIGFDGRMFITFGLPKPGGEGKQKACPFDIIFDDVDQIKAYEVIETAFTRRELEESVPVGLKIEIITAYSTEDGTVVLKATHRVSGLPYDGLDAYAQWVVVSLSGDTGGAATAITATSASLGLYTLTFLNGEAKLSADFEIQAEAPGDTKVTYLSNVLNIPV